MTACQKVRGLLALRPEDWSAEQQQQVEAHLPGCQACRATAYAYAEQDRRSRALPAATMTPQQRSRVLARVTAEGRRPARRRVLSLTGAAGAAVGLLLIALLALLLSNRGRPGSVPEVGGPLTPAVTGEPPQSATGGPGRPAGEGRLAYIQDGSLWIRPLPDGEPQLLVGESGLPLSEPRWSPSGEWLAFRRDTAVWLIRATGEDARAVDEGAVVNTFAWSPVEDRLAYVAGSGVLRLAVLTPGESEPLSLLSPDPAGYPGRFAWSPGGEAIAYEWRQGMEAQGLRLIPATMPAAQEPEELYDSGFPQRGEALLAGWTGDGRYVLFWQADVPSASLLADGVPFYALPAGGGEPLLLPGSALIVEEVGGDGAVLYHDDFLWSSPSWGLLALTVGAGRETWTNKRVVVVDLDGHVGAVTAGDLAAVSPAISPGGIAYAAAPDAGLQGGGDAGEAAVFRRRIWLVPADGSPARQLTGDEGYRDERPLWSADGSHVLFARMDQGERVSLWLLSAAGGSPQQLADGLGPWPGAESGWPENYGHLDWDALFDWWRGPVASTPEPEPTPAPTTVASAGGHVPAVLQDAPAPGEVVELDAYFSGAAAALTRGALAPAPELVACPTHRAWAAALVGRPLLAALRLLSGTGRNVLPADAANGSLAPRG